jgi:hypothetical protein
MDALWCHNGTIRRTPGQAETPTSGGLPRDRSATLCQTGDLRTACAPERWARSPRTFNRIPAALAHGSDGMAGNAPDTRSSPNCRERPPVSIVPCAPPTLDRDHNATRQSVAWWVICGCRRLQAPLGRQCGRRRSWRPRAAPVGEAGLLAGRLGSPGRVDAGRVFGGAVHGSVEHPPGAMRPVGGLPPPYAVAPRSAFAVVSQERAKSAGEGPRFDAVRSLRPSCLPSSHQQAVAPDGDHGPNPLGPAGGGLPVRGHARAPAHRRPGRDSRLWRTLSSRGIPWKPSGAPVGVCSTPAEKHVTVLAVACPDR